MSYESCIVWDDEEVVDRGVGRAAGLPAEVEKCCGGGENGLAVRWLKKLEYIEEGRSGTIVKVVVEIQESGLRIRDKLFGVGGL